jgi:hypothetical protein
MKLVKQLVYIAMIALGSSFLVWNTPAWAEEKGAVPKTTKTVCKDVIGKDGKPAKNKDGTVRQACKVIKIHKKHEGTEIPLKK